MTHTPTPWFVSDWNSDFGDEPFMVHAQEREVLSSGQSSIWPDGIVKVSIASTEECDGDRIANAAFIVKAVNAYDKLVEALRLTSSFDTPVWFSDLVAEALEGLE